jgi:hypothetical protein
LIFGIGFFVGECGKNGGNVAGVVNLAEEHEIDGGVIIVVRRGFGTVLAGVHCFVRFLLRADVFSLLFFVFCFVSLLSSKPCPRTTNTSSKKNMAGKRRRRGGKSLFWVGKGWEKEMAATALQPKKGFFSSLVCFFRQKQKQEKKKKRKFVGRRKFVSSSQLSFVPFLVACLAVVPLPQRVP